MLSNAARQVILRRTAEKRMRRDLEWNRVLAEAVEAGQDRVVAFAELLSSDRGLKRLRGRRVGRRLASRLLDELDRRLVPEAVAKARATLATAAPRAAEKLVEIATATDGDPRDTIAASKTILQAAGVIETGGKGTVHVHGNAVVDARQQTVAVRELLLADPEAAEHARELGVRMARFAGGDGGAPHAGAA